MKNREWRFYDAEKVEWGIGPWTDEPDKMQWTDKDTGLPCLIVRNGMGALCGYVGIGKAHPWSGKDYDDDVVNAYVHGGLTFAAFCVEEDKEHGICHVADPGEEEPLWWFGFDCAHGGDKIPSIESDIGFSTLNMMESIFNANGSIGLDYRDISYVKRECAKLAAQLAEVK